MSLELPRALAPWARELDEWPLELALALEPILSRLSLALGHMPRQRAHAAGAPDGYGGLSRRGHYERLLVSEWLYADEAPEEFDRRAAQSEHLFLELARREPAAPGREIALFDAGPAQVGGPRLVQLALLVVFAARARAAGVPFSWGVVQAPSAGLVDEVNPQSVKRFLAARTAAEAAPVAWQAVLPHGPGDELWLVGAPGLADGWRRRAAWVAIDDVLERGPRRVSVSVHAGGRTRAPVVLELPADPQASRLLSAPFAARPAPQQAGELNLARAPMLFAAGGRRLIARAQNGNLLALHVPDEPDQRPEPTMTWRCPSPHVPVAAGVVQFRFLVVSRAADGHVLWGLGEAEGRQRRLRLPSPARAIAAPGEDEPLSPLVAAKKGALTRLWFHDADHRLLQIELGPPLTLTHPNLRSLELHAMREHVLALTVAYREPSAPLPDVKLMRLRPRGEPALHSWHRDLGLMRGLLLTNESGVQNLISEHAGGLWKATDESVIALQGDPEVVGAVRLGGEPALVTIEAKRRLIGLHAAYEQRRYLGDPDDPPILHACVSATRKRIAVLREDGRLHVYATDGRLLLGLGGAGGVGGGKT